MSSAAVAREDAHQGGFVLLGLLDGFGDQLPQAAGGGYGLWGAAPFALFPKGAVFDFALAKSSP